jgi:3-hydroxyisobutyryl-CoA hydrolase
MCSDDQPEVLVHLEAGRKEAAADQLRTPGHFAHLLRSAPVPVISFLNGDLAGSAAFALNAPIRIATDLTSFCSPETSIGYFPDAGRSHLLAGLKNRLGFYLALTGNRLFGCDLLHAGLADHYTYSYNLETLRQGLEDVTLVGSLEFLNVTINAVENQREPYGMSSVLAEMEQAFSADTLEEILSRLEKLDSNFSQQAATAIRRASPLMSKLTLRLLRKVANEEMDFASALRLENAVVGLAVQQRDINEGIRARLLENRLPRWSHPNAAAVSNALVEDLLQEAVQIAEKMPKLAPAERDPLVAEFRRAHRAFGAFWDRYVDPAGTPEEFALVRNLGMDNSAAGAKAAAFEGRLAGQLDRERTQDEERKTSAALTEMFDPVGLARHYTKDGSPLGMQREMELMTGGGALGSRLVVEQALEMGVDPFPSALAPEPDPADMTLKYAEEQAAAELQKPLVYEYGTKEELAETPAFVPPLEQLLHGLESDPSDAAVDVALADEQDTGESAGARKLVAAVLAGADVAYQVHQDANPGQPWKPTLEELEPYISHALYSLEQIEETQQEVAELADNTRAELDDLLKSDPMLQRLGLRQEGLADLLMKMYETEAELATETYH